jgi:pimeloyl-ACP methyl ester carboxylesterase
VAFVSGALRAVGDHLMLNPQRGVEDPHGATRRLIDTPRGPLEIFVARAGTAPPRAYVLRFVGNADRADRWISREASEWSGIEFWGVNYPGFGGSAGDATLRNVAQASLEAYDALAREANGRPIFAFGTSMGTAAALHVAAERKLSGLMLRNPPALKQLVIGDHGWWNLWLLAAPVAWQIPDGLDSVENAHKSHVPAVILTADTDDIVPPRYQQLVIDAYAGQKTVIVQPHAKHNTPLDPATLEQARAALGTLLGS